MDKLYLIYSNLSETEYLNLTTKRKVSKETADKKLYCNDKRKICSDEEEIFDMFIFYLDGKSKNINSNKDIDKLTKDLKELSISPTKFENAHCKHNNGEKFASITIGKINPNLLKAFPDMTGKINDLTVKITENKEDSYINLDSGRKVSAKTAAEKPLICDSLKFCGSDAQIFKSVCMQLSENKIIKNSQLPKESKNLANDFIKIEDNSEKTKRVSYKKEHIPQAVRAQVWKNYTDKVQDVCFCCRTTIIDSFNFHAGHIIAEACGGETTKDNLRPICQSCNLSMGKQNMFEFMKIHKMDGQKFLK